MSRRLRSKAISPVNLREVYAEMGDQSIKFIINPSRSPSIDSIDARMTNSDGRPMSFSFKRWGTKLNVFFKIDCDTPDGVSIIDFTMNDRNSGEIRERFDLWIIK